MGLTGSKSPVVDMAGALGTSIREQIANEHILMYSRKGCPYCTVAKSALDEVGAQYKFVDLTNDPQKEPIMDILKEITGARTYPRVFIGGKCIGGGSETKALLKSGELKKMVQST